MTSGMPYRIVHALVVLAVTWILMTFTGCATLGTTGGERTSVEHVLRSTTAIDRKLTTPGSREVASQRVRFPRLPLTKLRVTSSFRGKKRPDHQGIDLDGRRGNAIFATADGIVVYAGDGIRGYGLTVTVRHGRGLATLYAHADSLDVRPGDAVTAGQRLGSVGATGNASGPHLHFEVRRDLAAVDPTRYLPVTP